MNNAAERLAWMILNEVRALLSDLPGEIKIIEASHRRWPALEKLVDSAEIELPNGSRLEIKLSTSVLK